MAIKQHCAPLVGLEKPALSKLALPIHQAVRCLRHATNVKQLNSRSGMTKGGPL
jgi:hypothetical protein